METQSLTIKDQVQEVISKSGVAFEIDITELFSLAERARAITDVHHPDFYTVKKEMQQKRKYIKDYMLDARAEFNRLSKGVIEVEKMVLAEFTPEEDRLIALDKAEKERIIKEERLAALPARNERIITAGIKFDTEEEILALTDADFELVFATKLAAKAEADRLAAEQKLAEERAVLEAEKAELARKQAEADRIEAARQEEREKAANDARLAEENKKKAAEEAIKARHNARINTIYSLGLVYSQEYDSYIYEDINVALVDLKTMDDIVWANLVAKIGTEVTSRKLVKEAEKKRLAHEQAMAEAEAKRAADEKWQTFLKDNNFNEVTDIIRPTEDGKTHIYRLVATYE